MASILCPPRFAFARVISVKPEPLNFAALVRNVAPYENVTPSRAALWNNDGEITLGSSDASPKGAFQVVENGGTRVADVTMDTLMRETGIETIDLLKVDVEGAEKEVLAARDRIKKVRIIAIELDDCIRPGCQSVVEAAAIGFHPDQRCEVTFFVR
jgi:FkbM family methyltransferase